MHKDAKIYIAGHRGMVGSAVWRALEKKGYTQLIGKTSAQLDLRNQQAVLDLIKALPSSCYYDSKQSDEDFTSSLTEAIVLITVAAVT